MLYSKSLLAIYFIFSSVYMLILISSFIPSHLNFLLVTISIFSVSVDLFL